jgi:hypothetical protein
MYVDEMGHGKGGGVSYVERWRIDGHLTRADDDETVALFAWRIRWAASRYHKDQIRSCYVAIGATHGTVVEATKLARRKATQLAKARKDTKPVE